MHMLKLVKLKREDMPKLLDMMDEWTASGEKIIPYAIRREDYHDFDRYVKTLETEEAAEGLVPDSTYFCLDTDRDIFVGAVNIRHGLNDKLRLLGGHVGDGVRPSERGHGIGTEMVALAIKKCRELGLERVLMVCDKSNIASARTIIKNGGVLENEVQVDGVVHQRYWIDLG